MAKTKRRGGVQTPESKAKSGARIRAQRKIRESKPELCEVCGKVPPIDHLLIDGHRVWMCRICFLAPPSNFRESEIENHTRTGASSLAGLREG